MVEYVVVSLVALIASALTFFSGFGLGTILVPVFALFFPIQYAITLTAIVHFLNNIFKLFLVGKNINKSITLKFGVPAILFSFFGALILTLVTEMKPIITYSAFGSEFVIMPVKLLIAVLLAFFALFDIIPFFTRINFDKKYLPIGGILSGFFGGLSGNQGALRSAFLIKLNLTKEEFIATGVIISVMIDISRLSVYMKDILLIGSNIDYALIVTATLSAFIGAFFGNKLLKKMTIKTLQVTVAIFLLLFSLLLGAGII